MSEVNVVHKTQRIIVDPASTSVSVINAGPIGPTGITGPPGDVNLAQLEAAVEPLAPKESPTFTGSVIIPDASLEQQAASKGQVDAAQAAAITTAATDATAKADAAQAAAITTAATDATAKADAARVAANIFSSDDATTKMSTAIATAATDATTKANAAEAAAIAASQPLATVLTNTTASFTTDQETKLAGVEALADVTDATNVEAAGALMDSEVTNLADVKAFDTTDYATSAQGTLADGAVAKSLADAKGDVFAATAANTVARVAVGADGDVLTADSAEASGVKWAAGADVTSAAPITAKDPVTGRLAIGGMEMGDTGWRSLLGTEFAPITGTWNVTQAMIRRTGNVVMWAVGATSLVGPTTEHVVFMPDGFRFGETNQLFTVNGLATPAPTAGILFNSGAPYGIRNRSGDTAFRSAFLYLAHDAWPTSLPGTQISAPLA